MYIENEEGIQWSVGLTIATFTYQYKLNRPHRIEFVFGKRTSSWAERYY